MKIDHSCIKRILDFILYRNKDFLQVDFIVSRFQYQYPEDVILFHINEIHKMGLVNGATYNNNKMYLIQTLSEKGHAFLNDRD